MHSYSVEGMTCEHCAATVTKAAKKADPGATVNIDIPKGTVAIDSAVDEADICEAIRGAGYEPRPLA